MLFFPSNHVSRSKCIKKIYLFKEKEKKREAHRYQPISSDISEVLHFMFYGTNDFLVTFSIKNLNFGHFLRNRVVISFLLVILLSLCIYPLFRKSSVFLCGQSLSCVQHLVTS